MSTSQKHLIIIGAQRAGSSWLYELLDSHPDVFMQRPRRPEPKYFLKEDVNYPDYLLNVFRESPSNIAYLGEKSTSYYEFPSVAERIVKCIPSVKCILILRDPVERALSNYRFSVQNGLENRSLAEVFLSKSYEPKRSFEASVNPFAYVQRGMYSKYVQPFYKALGNQLHIMILEEATIGNSADGVWGFLGLEPIDFSLGRVNETIQESITRDVRNVLRGVFAEELVFLERIIGRKLDVWRDNWRN